MSAGKTGITGRTILAGLGVGVLFTLVYTCPLLSPDHRMIYHSRLPMPSVAGGLLIDIAIVTLLGAALLWFLESSRAGELHLAWSVIGACLALAAVAVVTEVLGVPAQHRYLIRAGGGAFLGSLACRWLRPSAYKIFSRGLRVLFLLAGISAAWIVPELVYLVFAHPRMAVADPRPQITSAGERKSAAQNPRVVWVLFDELSYDQSFEHRSPTVKMPNFDRLAWSSVGFADLQPVSYFTELAIPSFFLGVEVKGLKSDMRGMPMLRVSGERGWRPFQPRDTIFAAARSDGWTTGVAGWYNPYCRILAGELDTCHAVVDNLDADGLSSENSTLKNASLPVAVRLERYLRFFQSTRAASQSGLHLEDYKEVMRQAKRLLRDEKVRFVFVHLPIPHPGGIYDRRTGQLRNGGDYLDNLALADRALGELTAVLRETASANRTTLIVCSDHSWRVNLWRQWPGWTKEEEEASMGVFDPRPVLLIHFPGETAMRVVRRPFPELRLHQILFRMIVGEMGNRGAFDRWLSGEQAMPQPEEDSSPSAVVARR